MESAPRTDFFHGLFEWLPQSQGRPRLKSSATAPRSIPDPLTGFPLQIASVELSASGVCPSCTEPGEGGYISFVSDLRLAFACPSCRKLVWLAGA